MSTTTMRSLYVFLVMLLVNSVWAAAPPPAKHHPPFLLTTSPFTFSEAAISTQPSEVIQICVDKNAGVPTFSNTIFVEVVGNKLPHLSNFSGQSLFFSGGATQACFNLTIGSDQSSLAYTLGIQGATEELEITVDHHVMGFCGVISNLVNAQGLSSSLVAAELLDRFGNSYTYEDLAINFGGLECTQSGHFALEFTPNFTQGEITTICSVFEYLSTLIVSQATEIPIRIRKDALFAGALAAGTEFYRADTDGGGCGIENSIIWEYINTDSDFGGILDDNYVVGRIDISDTGSWHTLDMDTGPPNNPGVMNGDYDLYSIVLHEALHVLGFASRVTADGSPLNGFYTAWDREMKGLNTTYIDLLAGVTNGACCDDHTYNTLLSSPNQIAYDCNSVKFPYGDNEQATVWGEYDVVDFPSENSFIVNVLSHLNGDCDNADYVMVSELADATANRFVSTQEKGILCQLGYQVLDGGIPACSTACAVVAVNDLIFLSPDDLIVSGSPTPVYSVEIEYATITGNDFLPSGATVEVYACDPLINVIVVNDDPDDTKFSIRGFSPGQVFTVCYTISGCDGICDDAIVTIAIELSDGQVIVGSGPACGEQENIVGWGDFEDFMVIPEGANNSYFSQTTLQACDPFGNNVFGSNTPGIREDVNGNLYAYMAGRFVSNQGNGTNCESIFLPLTQPIFPGCSITLEFDVHSRFHSTVDYSFLEFYGSFLPPCASNLFSGNCVTSQSENDIYCIRTGNDGFLITQNLEIGTTPSRFGPYTWTNNTGVPINYLIAINNNAALGQEIEWSFPNSLDFGIDNVSVIQNCDNQLTITSNVLAACEDEGVIIDYEICLTGSSTGARDVNLTLDLPSLPGVLFGNGDFTSNQYTVTNVVPNGECRTVRLVLDLNSSPLGAGDAFTVQLGGVALGTCIDDPNLTEVSLDDCDNCDPLQAGFTHLRDCLAESITFTANNSAGIHSWVINEVTYQGNPLTIPINDLTNDENYTVEHIVLNECFDEFRSTEVDILIEACLVCDPIPAGFTSTQDCGTSFITFTANNPAGVHSWLIDGVAFQGNPLTIPIAEPTMNDAYSVVHTIDDGCETPSMFSTTVVVDACEDCEDCVLSLIIGTAGNNITLSQAIASSLLPAGGAANASFCIAGDLVLEAGDHYGFNNCNVRMLPGASISIEEGASLGIENNTALYSCESMWQGILVREGGTIKAAKSSFANAYCAIRAISRAGINPQPTDVQLVKNQFYNNFVGLYVGRRPGGGLIQLQLNQNVFSTMENLFPATNITPIGALPALGTYSLAGVILNDLNLVASSHNDFDGLTIGLWTINTDLIVDDNSFTNMQAGVPAYPTLNYKGMGLVTERVDAGLYSTVVLDSEFDNCRIGISSRFCSLKVYGNDMDNVTTGITANLPNMGPVAIGASGTYGNVIDASENGILTAGFSFNSPVYIENNQITLDASTGRKGIRLALTQSNDANVRDNIIALAGTGQGMEFVGVENTHITNNTVNLLNSPLATVGISLRGAEHILLQGNTVTGTAITGDDDKNIAIDIFSSPDIGYCCNTLDDTRIGVRVRGSSLSTDQFRATSFGDHATGLRIEENSVLGSQSHTENSWTGAYSSGFGAVYDVDPITAQEFPFFVDETPPNGSSVFLTANQPVGWFFPEQNSNSTISDYCNLTQCSLENFFGPGTDDEYFIAGGSNLNPFTPAVAWQAQKYAYERYNSNYLAYSSGMSSYVQTMNNNNIGAHSNYKGQVQNCFLLNATDRTAVDNHYVAKETELTTLKDWEALFVLSGATALGTQSQADRANLFGNAWQTSQTGATLGSGIITNQESTASTLLAVDLPSTASYTTNSELTLQLQLSAALRPWIGLSPTNLQALETTAAECALTDGNGVFQAQGLLAFLDDQETYYDDGACDKGKALQKAAGDNAVSQPLDKQRFQLEQQFKASPNPSSQRQITVQVPSTGQAAELQLSNLQGQTLKRWSLNKDQQFILISLEGIPDGLFLLRWSDGEINLTTKLILQ